MYIIIALLIIIAWLTSMVCIGWLHVRGWDPQWWHVACILFVLWAVSTIQHRRETRE